MANGITYQLSSYVSMVMNATGEENIDNCIPVDIDLIPKNADGTVKQISVDYTSSLTGKKTAIQTPDYSALYDIDRLSKEINAWYDLDSSQTAE